MARSTSVRIQDQISRRKASVVPLLTDPTKNGLVVCRADGTPIGRGVEYDTVFYVSKQ